MYHDRHGIESSVCLVAGPRQFGRRWRQKCLLYHPWAAIHPNPSAVFVMLRVEEIDHNIYVKRKDNKT